MRDWKLLSHSERRFFQKISNILFLDSSCKNFRSILNFRIPSNNILNISFEPGILYGPFYSFLKYCIFQYFSNTKNTFEIISIFGPKRTKFYLLYRTTYFNLSQIVVGFAIGI